MAEAIISGVADRLAATVAKQIRSEVNLLRCVDQEILNLSHELKTIGYVLDDAERRGFKDKSIKDWLKRLEETTYDMDDVLDEWNMAILRHQMEQSDANVVPTKYKVCSCIPSPCFCFKKIAIRHDIAKKIENIKANLNRILADKDRFGFVTSQPTDHSDASWKVQSTSLIDLKEVCGRDYERNELVSKLVPEGCIQEELGIEVLSIVGVGGLGKTTLAQLAYNDSRVNDFFELRIWICVSDPFDEVEIAKGIIEGAGGSSLDTKQLDMLLQRLKESISGKKFFLVLDDVWTPGYTKWETLKNSLRCGGAGSKILVTTRNKMVAIRMGSVEKAIHHLGHLSHEDCWSLLRQSALPEKSEEECDKFKNVGRDIANKCKGLPLAAKTLGGLLRFKNTLEEWENVLNSEIWDLEEVEVDLFPHLLLSYNELSPTLKQCFSYCAVFPKDYRINVDSLITRWMALGFLRSNGSSADDWKLRAREYFDKLALRSLFQDFEKGDLDEQIQWFKMHDILHDFARFIRKNDRVGAGMKKTTCETCSPLLVSHVKEYRSLIYYYYEELPWHPCDCLTILRLLSLGNCGLQSIPKEIEKLIHLRWLDVGCNRFSPEDLKILCKLYNLQFLWVNSCKLEEIPWEIGNLIHLKHLDLSGNKLVKELPESLCDLRELESLDVENCYGLSGLPQGIGRLINLKHLCNTATHSLEQFPQGLAKLTGLRTLNRFCAGGNWSKLGWLKNLNQLGGSLQLQIKLTDESEEVVEDARVAELWTKEHIQALKIHFSGNYKVREESVLDALEPKLAAIDPVLDALEPHPNLQNLEVWNYCASQLPGWITSPVNQLRSIKLFRCEYLSSLPPLSKLPLLENIEMSSILKLQFVGHEFLGMKTRTMTGDMDIEASSSSVGAAAINTIEFPKLKKLTFHNFRDWKEWEDITAEEEDPAVISLMPCLTKLTIKNCKSLTTLPHRLLRKAASSLEELDISGSTELERVYGDKEGEAWKSISHHNPRLYLSLFHPI